MVLSWYFEYSAGEIVACVLVFCIFERPLENGDGRVRTPVMVIEVPGHGFSNANSNTNRVLRMELDG